MLTRLVEASDRTQLDNTVITLQPGGSLAPRLARAGVAVHDLGLGPGRFDPRALWRLAKLLRRLNPDVLQTWLYHADLAGLLTSFIVRGPRLMWNIRCTELDPSEYSWILAQVLRVLAAASGRPSAVIANSVAGIASHERLGYHPRRWEVIPNGFDTELFRPSADARAEIRRELGVSEGTLLVGHVGRFHPMKGHDVLLRAAARVAERLDHVNFVLVGKGTESESSVTDLVNTSGIGRRVHRLGERRDIATLLAAFDIVVSSSHSEGFPNVVGEAMSCGVPCVVSDVGDSATLLGGCGVVVPPRDSEQLALGILRVLAMESSARQAMGAAGRTRIVSHYSLERIVNRYRELYLDIAQGRVCAA